MNTTLNVHKIQLSIANYRKDKIETTPPPQKKKKFKNRQHNELFDKSSRLTNI